MCIESSIEFGVLLFISAGLMNYHSKEVSVNANLFLVKLTQAYQDLWMLLGLGLTSS